MLIAPTPECRTETFTWSVEILPSAGEDLRRSGDVGLQDEREVLDVALLHPVEERFERDPRGLNHRLLALLLRAERDDLARLRISLSTTWRGRPAPGAPRSP